MPGIFTFLNLTDETRRLMLAEVEIDEAAAVLYMSQCFNETGPFLYPKLLRAAITSFNEMWLAQELQAQGCFGLRYLDSNGKDSTVPKNAHERFAQGEFNRFYCRALCQHALANPGVCLFIYRGRESSFKRPESEAKIGMQVDPAEVLQDLRSSVGASPFFGMPEVGSGLSLKFD